MPHLQGAMDGLCGAYSIVNAMKILRNDSCEESQQLFHDIIHYLDKHHNLPDIVLNGMTIGILYRMVNAVIEDRHAIERKRPFVGNTMALGLLWEEMEAFLNDGDNGVAVAIIALSGVHDHWTVVKRITRNSIYFEDSDGLKRISRHAITVHLPNVRRRHRVNPYEVIFLNNPHIKQKSQA